MNHFTTDIIDFDSSHHLSERVWGINPRVPRSASTQWLRLAAFSSTFPTRSFPSLLCDPNYFCICVALCIHLSNNAHTPPLPCVRLVRADKVPNCTFGENCPSQSTEYPWLSTAWSPLDSKMESYAERDRWVKKILGISKWHRSNRVQEEISHWYVP